MKWQCSVIVGCLHCIWIVLCHEANHIQRWSCSPAGSVQGPVTIVVCSLKCCSICLHKKAENLDGSTDSTSNVQGQCPTIILAADQIGWKQLEQGLKVVQCKLAKR